MNVPLLDLDVEAGVYFEEAMTAIRRVAEAKQFILGEEVRLFEEELAAYCNAKYAIGVSSGTDALTAALMAAGIGANDRVLTSPFTFFATAGSVVRLGAEVVFGDVDQWTGMLKRVDVDARAFGCSLIVPVHLFGGLCWDESWKPDCPIITDACQALGVDDHRKILASCTSFHPSKVLGGWGDGGAVVTNDESFAIEARAIRQHGVRKKKYHHDIVGGNFRLDAIQAAVLRVKLKRLPDWLEQRRQIAQKYNAAFKESDDLIPVGDTMRKIWSVYAIRVRYGASVSRDSIVEQLRMQGIQAGVYYPESLYTQPCLRSKFMSRPETVGDLPNQIFALPIWPGMADQQINYVIDQVLATLQ